MPGQAAGVAAHHEAPTGALLAPLAARLHQLAHQAPGPILRHTVVVGGMPSWQIALIAAAAAVLTAALAVLLDRARADRRHLTAPARDPAPRTGAPPPGTNPGHAAGHPRTECPAALSSDSRCHRPSRPNGRRHAGQRSNHGQRPGMVQPRARVAAVLLGASAWTLPRRRRA